MGRAMHIEIKKLFLASSNELKEDRQEFEIFILRENKEWVKQGVSLEVVKWEDFLNPRYSRPAYKTNTTRPFETAISL